MRWLLTLLLTTTVGCQQRTPRPEVIFEPEAKPLANGRDPRVVVRASGDIFALLAAQSEAGADAALFKSGNGGDLFQAAGNLNPTSGEVIAHGETGPRLLLGPSSEFYAVWASAGALRVARSRTYGRTFEPPVDVPTGTTRGPSFFTAELAPDGTLLLAWFASAPGKETPPGTTHLHLASSDDGGVTFQVRSAIASAVCPCCRPGLAADGEGRWYLAYRAVSEGDVRDMVAMVSSDRGNTWSAPAPLAEDGWRIRGCPHSGPSLQVAGGKLHIAWYSEGAGTGTVYWTASPLGALTFEPRRILSEGVRDANHPVLAAEADTVWAAFQGRDPEERDGWGPVRIYVRRLEDRAKSYAAPALGESASYPELRSMGAGRWILAWNAAGRSGTQVAVARFRVSR